MKSIGFINSASLVLTRVCREACGYCAFHRTTDGLLPLKDLLDVLPKIRGEKGIEVILLSGEEPQEYPHIQMALKREECGSFLEYLEKACKTVLAFDLLPVPAIASLDALTAKTLAGCAAAVRIDVVPADLKNPGEAHENARRRNLQAGRESIQHAHEAELPYSLGILVGIGETQDERLAFVREIGRFCASDPYLQDVRIIPFQPCPGTPLHARPPLSLTELAAVIREGKEVFPVHQISVPANLCSGVTGLLESGVNDLGSLPYDGNDPVMPGFPFPKTEDMAARLLAGEILLKERLPLTTNAGFKRPAFTAALESCRHRMKNRGRSSLDLIDDSHCFVCGRDNAAGLKLTFQMCGPFTCAASWTPTKAFQGYAGILHGGIISTLLDEIMAQSLIRSGVQVVTADMTIRFLKPAPLGVPLRIGGTRVGGRKHLHMTRATIQSADGVVYAEAEGRYIEC